MADAKRKGRVTKDSTENPGTTQVAKDPQTLASQHGDMIARAAYYKAQKRGFAPGLEMQDWLGAETEIEIDESLIQH